jgi:hypothetical protein
MLHLQPALQMFHRTNYEPLYKTSKGTTGKCFYCRVMRGIGRGHFDMLIEESGTPSVA